MRAVIEALEGEVAEVHLVDVHDSGFVLPVDTPIAFNVIHGTYGEDGDLQAELESRGIAYTGARGASSRLAFDKVKVPKENLLGPLEKGFRVAMATLDGGRIGIAAQAVAPDFRDIAGRCAECRRSCRKTKTEFWCRDCARV